MTDRRTDPTPATAMPVPTAALPPHEAVIFNMDALLTETATLHAAAWRQLFDAVLAVPRSGGRHDPFDTAASSRRYIGGRSGEEAVGAFLAAGGIDLPLGQADDQPGAWSVHGLAARMNEIYFELLAEHGVRAFPGTVDLLEGLQAGGVPVALVTPSRKARALLAAAGLVGVLDVVVEGERAVEATLWGEAGGCPSWAGSKPS